MTVTAMWLLLTDHAIRLIFSAELSCQMLEIAISPEADNIII